MPEVGGVHGGGARVRAHLGSGLPAGSAFRHGGESVQLDSGQDGAAVLKTADGLGEIVRQRARGISHVARGHARIPDALRINHYVGPALAKAERAARRDLYLVRQSLGRDLFAQGIHEAARATC